MRRVVVALAFVMVVAGLSMVVDARPVFACSCARTASPDVSFVGTVTETMTGHAVRFDVEHVRAGNATDGIVVRIPQNDRDGDVRFMNTCAVAERIAVGDRLAVEATTADGTPYANLCSGSVQVLAQAELARARSGPVPEEGSNAFSRVLIVSALVMLGAGSGSAVLWRRRATRP